MRAVQMKNSGMPCRENAGSRLSPLSCPPPGLAFGEPDDRLLRASSIPEALHLGTAVSGILDRPVKPGDDDGESAV